MWKFGKFFSSRARETFENKEQNKQQSVAERDSCLESRTRRPEHGNAVISCVIAKAVLRPFETSTNEESTGTRSEAYAPIVGDVEIVRKHEVITVSQFSYLFSTLAQTPLKVFPCCVVWVTAILFTKHFIANTTGFIHFRESKPSGLAFQPKSFLILNNREPSSSSNKIIHKTK